LVPFGMFVIVNAGGVEEQAVVPAQLKCTPKVSADQETVGIIIPTTISNTRL
jgi:hypothetical protein